MSYILLLQLRTELGQNNKQTEAKIMLFLQKHDVRKFSWAFLDISIQIIAI